MRVFLVVIISAASIGMVAVQVLALQAGQQEAGAARYADICQSCHGVAGREGLAPALAAMDNDYEQVLAIVREGLGEMPPISTRELSDEEVRQIVAYLKSLRFASEPPTATAQTPPKLGSVIRLDPALDAIVPPDVKFEVLKEDYFGSTEGPVWMAEGQTGFLLFSDQAANRIYKWTAGSGLSVFLEPAGYTGDPAKWPEVAQLFYNQRLYIGLVGSNGLAVDREGRLIMCARGDRALVRLERDGTRTVLADRYNGQRLLSPNDLAVKSDGSVYFSAPGPPRPDGAPRGLYRWNKGRVELLATEIGGGVANGLAFSPDEKFLYIIAAGKIYRFNVLADGRIADGRFFAGESGADGLKVDRNGNLYFGGPGGLWIVAPDGKHLGTIAMGRFTNVAFGDTNRKTLYLTIQRGLARIRLLVPGV